MRAITDIGESTITVFVPLELRRRNGRPRIVQPDDNRTDDTRERANAAVVRALARAWDWRRRLEAGEAATLQDIAVAEKVSDRFVSFTLRLAYLSPSVLDKLLANYPCAVSIKALMEVAERPWAEQEKMVFSG